MISRIKSPEDARLEYIFQVNKLLASGGTDNFNEAIRLTCNFLGMEFGIISKIVHNRYFVLYSNYTDYVKLDDTFDLGETLCRVVYKSTHAFDLSSLKFSGCEGHPMLSPSSLKSYLGIPISANGVSFGTFCLIHTSKEDVKFDLQTKELMEQVGIWIGSAIQKNNLRDNINDLHEELSASQDINVELSTQLNRTLFEHNELKQIVLQHLKPTLEEAIFDPYTSISEGDKTDLSAAIKNGLFILDKIAELNSDAALSRASVNPVKFSLNSMMIEIFRLYKPIAKSQGISLKLELPNRNIIVNSDTAILKDIISEILKYVLIKSSAKDSLHLVVSDIGQIKLHQEYGSGMSQINSMQQPDHAGIELYKASNLAEKIGLFLNVNKRNSSDFWVQIILPATIIVPQD